MSTSNANYKTASGFSEFVAFIGWSAILVSGIAGFVIYEQAGSFGMIAIPICIATALVGLLLVVAGQSLHAQLETANATKKLLELQLEKNE